MPEKLSLYIPKLFELDYRQRLLSDAETMAYNNGCIDFPREKWESWYGFWVGNEPQSFTLI